MATPAIAAVSPSPRASWPAVAIGALLATVLAVVLVVAPARRGTTVSIDAVPAFAAYRDCRFEDGEGADAGAVLVRDAVSGELLARVAPGEQGFLRGTLRALVRERRQQGLGAEPAFRLLRLTDGRLALRDLGTRRQLDLSAFGPTNAALFARLLPAAPAR